MKRLGVSIIILAMLVGLPIILGAQSTTAQPGSSTAPDVNKHSSTPGVKTIIDFSIYQTRIDSEKGKKLVRDEKNEPKFDYNTHTFESADTDIYPEEPADLKTLPTDESGTPLLPVTKKHVGLNKWKVQLNSSANNIENKVLSYCREVKTQGQSAQTVLGIRIHFPTHSYNAWARISPPFPVKVYDELGNLINLENGVINNTGSIKKIKLSIAGRNFKNSVAIRLRDQNGDIKEYFMGSLFFNGWRTLEWSNPNYIETLNHRELFRLPLYPYEVPHLVFDSFVIYRNGDHIGGDFVTYIKGLTIEYDLAVEWPSSKEEVDIFDEDVWNILKVKAAAKADYERKAFADYLQLMYTEEKKQGKKAEASATTNPGGGNN